MPPVTLARLRRQAIARSLFAPRPLAAAIDRLGFVQADPIRSPARAQDLILRQRVPGYRAGDLERGYGTLDIDEDFFVNYGFLTRPLRAVMHPRTGLRAWVRPGRKVGEAVLDYVRAQGSVHPRQVDAHFAHGAVRNYWGGSSSATTHVLDHLHYRGLLRVVGRESGIRRYASCEVPPPVAGAAARRARQDAFVDAVVALYAPLPSATLSWLVNRMRHAMPQWRTEGAATLRRAKARLAHARVADLDWYWPEQDTVDGDAQADRVALLAPFDPVVWDRRRFEAFWNWAYRFEAYTPAAKRQFGYYALPMLWRDQVIGWANVALVAGTVVPAFGYVSGRAPREAAFRRALDAEVAALQSFLGPGTTS